MRIAEFRKSRDDSEDMAMPIEPAAQPAASAGALCVAPFAHLHIATTGTAAPCCEFKGTIGSVRERNVDGLWNGAALAEIRQRMVAGERLTECWKCHDREDAGMGSLRTQLNRHFASHLARAAAGEATALPVAFDIRFSNLCNFRCRTCWHASSSRWFVDARKLGTAVADQAEIRSFDSVEVMMAELEPALPMLEELYFAGGEPLLMPEHHHLLRVLADRGLTHVRLRYNTNLSETAFRGESLLDLWRKFPRVHVAASVDAAGEAGELIRKEQRWEGFVANANRLQAACPHVDLRYETTVSALNILYLSDMLAELIERCAARPMQFGFHVLQEPRHYSIQVLPDGLKRQAAKTLRRFVAELLESGRFDGEALDRLAREVERIIDYMNQPASRRDLRRLRRELTRLDTLRGEDSARTLSRLVSGLTWRGRLGAMVGIRA